MSIHFLVYWSIYAGTVAFVGDVLDVLEGLWLSDRPKACKKSLVSTEPEIMVQKTVSQPREVKKSASMHSSASTEDLEKAFGSRFSSFFSVLGRVQAPKRPKTLDVLILLLVFLAEVTDLLPSMDFNHFTEYYKKKRQSLRVEEKVLEEPPAPNDLNALDGVLHSALEVAQELLSDATSAALVRAEHTLRLRRHVPSRFEALLAGVEGFSAMKRCGSEESATSRADARQSGASGV